MSSQIFLYSSGGRTLWVPRHTPSASETKPVCMLTSATPMELSRSFYLFDYPVQVVESAQMAAINPNAKTPNEVIAAVNDFRRVCAEDQSFLLQRCYNPQSQSPQHSQSQKSPNPQQQSYQGNYLQPISSSSLSGGVGGTPAMDNAALLAQLLQQQRQQQPQPQMPMMGGGSGGGSFPDMSMNSYNRNSFGDDMGGNNNNSNNYYGGRGGGRGGYRNGMYGNNNNNMPFGADMMMQQQQNPMLGGGGYNNNNSNNFGMDPNMMMYGGGNNNMSYPRGRGGRRDGQMYGNYGNPMMQQQQMMMGGRRGGAMMMGNNMNNNMMNAAGQSRLAPNARHEAEPITIDVEIPDEIKNVYMNPQQQVVIATMPGPHMTVWLREHPIPTDTQDKKFVFGKNGVILMLKAAFEEVKSSKPVELFPKQICTHFFIYGYCSRANCFHEHHSEQQVRELIAARHVQLKAMTKAQRHHLIDEIEEKEKAGIAATEAQREEREKRRAEMMAERESRRQQRLQMRDAPTSLLPPMTYSMPSSQKNPSQDIGSDNDDADLNNNNNTTTTKGNADTPQLLGGEKDALTETVAPNASQNAEAEAGKTPASDALAKLGITDSDSDAEEKDDEDDDDDDDDASSSNESDAEPVEEEKKEAAPAEQGEEEEEEDEEEQEAEEKPVAKKRGRPPAAKKSAKRAKN